MTRKGLNVFARIFTIVALFSIFLPFINADGTHIFGAVFFEPYSIEELYQLQDAYVAGPNLFYILALLATCATLILSFLWFKGRNWVVTAVSAVATVMFALVGWTFNSLYSLNGDLSADGINTTLDAGWYFTTVSMLLATVLWLLVALFGNHMEDHKMISEVQRRNRVGWWFISPFIIGFLCFYLQPLVISLWYTFNEFRLDVSSGGGFLLTFVGLDNFRYMFGQETDFWTTLTSTFTDMFIAVPIVIIFSMFIALILNQKFHGRMLARAIFFMPVVVTGGIVMGIINGDTLTQFASDGVETTSTTSIFTATGLMEILEGMNLPVEVIDVFSSIVSSIFDTLWKCGVQILLFLSALQSIPNQLYEAAKIEGATGWETFWKVTFPNLVPIILVNIVYTIIDAVSNPDNALMKSIENMAFVKFNYHRACLEAWIFFVLLLLLVAIVFGIFALINREKKPARSR